MFSSWQTPGQAGSLQPQEQDEAASIAAQVPWQDKSLKQRSHPLGMQTLFVEKPEIKRATGERLARVYQYDYGLQGARLVDVDLDRQTATQVKPIDSVHLPLSEQEILFARSLLAQSVELLSRLRAEQELRGRIPFTSLEDIEVKASIYEPRDPLHPCSQSRCALLSLFDATRTVFSIEPLVYLNTQQVGELNRR